MSISVDGIISGIDTSGLIADLVGAYSAPKGLLEDEINDFNSLQEALTGLSSRLGDLQTSLEDLGSEDDIREYTVNYTETDAFIAEATGEAAEGVYSVEVTSLATSELEVSQGFADSSTLGTIGRGDLVITVAGEDTTITIDDTNDSLNEMAAAIDDVDGVSAYVMNTGDATNPYRLVVQATETGSDNTISFDTSALAGGAVPTFTEQTAAADAQLSINGIDVTSASNTVTDSIQGFKLTLTGTTTDPVDVSVSLDADAVQDKFQTFVDAYNEIIDYVATNSGAQDEENGIASGIFNGDSSVRRIMSNLSSFVATNYEGSSATLNSLGLMGISLENDGKLSIDGAEFQDALDDDRDSVMAMFTEAAGFGVQLSESLDVYIDPTEGTIKQRSEGIDNRVDALEDQIGRWEERILSYESRLRSGFASFESAAGALQGTAQFINSYFFSAE